MGQLGKLALCFALLHDLLQDQRRLVLLLPRLHPLPCEIEGLKITLGVLRMFDQVKFGHGFRHLLSGIKLHNTLGFDFVIVIHLLRAVHKHLTNLLAAKVKATRP